MCVWMYVSLSGSCQGALCLSGRAQAHPWGTTETRDPSIPALAAARIPFPPF